MTKRIGLLLALILCASHGYAQSAGGHGGGGTGGGGSVPSCTANSFPEYLATGKVLSCAPNLSEDGTGYLNYIGSKGIAAVAFKTNGAGPGVLTLGVGTVATLPNPATMGAIVNISDANPDCSTGGGSTAGTCRCDSATCAGSGWTLIAGGSSAGTIAHTLLLLKGDNAGNGIASSISDTGTAPTRTPNGLNTGPAGLSNENQIGNDNPGTATNELACLSAGGLLTVCPTSATQGIMGVCVGGCGNSGVPIICTTTCAVKTHGNTTVGDWLVPSATTAGSVDDTGTSSLTTASPTQQSFVADTAVTAPATTAAEVYTPYTGSGGKGGGGNASGPFIQTNGTLNKRISNFNTTTPVAGTGDTNCTWATSNSGSTTSNSCYFNTVRPLQAQFPAIATAQTVLVMAPKALTFPANFAATGDVPVSAVKCGTNPGGTVVFTLTDVTTSTTLGTVSLSSSCVGTFATTGGTTQAVAINDQLSLVSGTDASGLNITFLLRAY